MKTLIRTLSFLLIGMISSLTVSAQEFQRSHFPERTPGWYTLGINGGFAYQTSDVKSRLDGYGLGLTLAKNYYYQPGSPISFDLRGRLLYSETFGLNTKRATGIQFNDALNGTKALDYSTENGGIGYVIPNYKTNHAEAGLEAVLTANRLRENTGIIISAFGGINLDWYNTNIDQANSNGTYDYTQVDDLNDSNSSIKSILKNNILDGVYETNAHGFEDGGKIKFMPSVGLELGYQFTPRFSMHVAHKATFAGTDDIDGQLWDNNNNPTGTNDVHHYTNAALRWIIEPAKKKVHAPEIIMIQPSRSPYSTRVPDVNIVADIKHVNSSMDVECFLNGQNHNFDFNGKRLRTNALLKRGRNEFLITATNSAGTAKELLILVFKEDRNEVPLPPPPSPPSTINYQPTVQITSPRGNSYTTEYIDFTVKADIKNVRSERDIDFYVNGRSENNFSYNNRNDEFTARIELNEGRNEIEIVAKNEAGNNRDEAVIILEQKLEKPSVKITRPSRNPYETDKKTTRVTADLERVTRKSDIKVRVNGRDISNFSFDTRSMIVEMNLNLVRGENTVIIYANNPAGQDNDRTVIIYDEPTATVPTVNAPQVKITSVNQKNSNQYGCESIVKAKVLNINSKNDITFRVNGRSQNFSFNNKTKLLTATVDLKNGRNDILIRATNEAGTDQDEERTSCDASTPIPTPQNTKPPVVRIDTPNNNSTTTKSTTTLKAKVTNVRNKQNIRVLLNGKSVNSFSFNPLSGVVSTQLNLVKGNNVIYVSGRNSDGKDEKTIRVAYEKASNPPVVKINNPNNGTTTNKDNTSVKATINNVTRKQDITLKVNGKTSNNFSFSGSNLTTIVKLKEGNNTISIKANNNDGTDEESVRITYKAPKVPTPPTVKITSPNNGTTTDKNSATIRATVKNITRKQDVTLRINGKTITNFSFRRNIVNANTKLKNGKNTISVAVKNSDGNDKDQVVVTYKPKVTIAKPVIKFIVPARTGTTAKRQRYTFRATVENVTSKKDIKLIFNKKTLTQFDFDAKKKVVSASVTLANGVNALDVKATNQAGTTTKGTAVKYSKPTTTKVEKPTIANLTASQPAAHPFNPTNLRSTINCTIKNLTSKNQVTLLVNGAQVNDFTFNPTTGKFQSSIQLKTDGTVNNFKITAKNSTGSAEESYTFEN